MNDLVRIPINGIDHIQSFDELVNFTLEKEQVEMSEVHGFSPGLYIRELTIKKGTFIIGQKHRFQHLSMFTVGEMTLYTKENPNGVYLCAPSMQLCEPGNKIAVTHTDCIWVNIFPTNETDVEKIEHELLDFGDYIKKPVNEELVNESRIDYEKMLEEEGIDEGFVSVISNSSDYDIPLPYGAYKFKKSDSSIHGKGIFATSTMNENELIGAVRIGENRTILGKFTNHSSRSNAKFVKSNIPGIDVLLVAKSKINGNMGGFIGDEILIDYRESLQLIKEMEG